MSDKEQVENSTAHNGGTDNIPPSLASPPQKFIDPKYPLSPLAQEYLGSMLARERNRATDLVMRAVEEGVSIRDIYLQVLQPVQYEIGWLWQHGRITVGHEHYCTNSTQLVMSMLYPRIFQGERNGKRMIATCVQGELHEIGLRMLSDFFEMAGWSTDYLGANMPYEGVVSVLDECEAHILCIGVTMHYHLDEVRTLIQAVRGSDQGKSLPVLVGGYPFRTVDGLWRKIGADATAENAEQALSVAEKLLEQRRKNGT